MTTFLLGAAAFVLLLTAVGLKPLLRARSEADRIMAVQLLGSGGIAALLLFAEGAERYAAIDVSAYARAARGVRVGCAGQVRSACGCRCARRTDRRPRMSAPHGRPKAREVPLGRTARSARAHG